jgi:IclR family transcriptional regulator, pca regulon regulatory protein
MGRVLLAGISPERLDQYFDTQAFVALTDRTVTDPKKLRRLIDDCRRTGYSAVEDELAYGVVAVAVPVYDLQGNIVAALNSSSHSKRISKAKLIRERLAILKQASRAISAEFSRVPGLALSALG